MPWVSATLEEARAAWPDAPEDDGELAAVLEAACSQCEAFAPVLGDADLPDISQHARFVRAQIMQARALYRSGTVGGGDTFGAEGMSVTVFPMDWTVKALLRPPTRPVVR